MDSNWRRRSITLGVVTLTALALGVGTAVATPGPTPNGFVGACNMVASWPGVGPAQGVGVQPGGGMERSMTVNNPNGNAGMFNAVYRSGNGVC